MEELSRQRNLHKYTHKPASGSAAWPLTCFFVNYVYLITKFDSLFPHQFRNINISNLEI